MKVSRLVLVGVVSACEAFAATTSPPLSSQLDAIRDQVLRLEQGLIQSLRSQKQAQSNVKKIQTLVELQRQERELGKKRLAELEVTVKELESRRTSLNERIREQQKSIHRFLLAMDRSQKGEPVDSQDRPVELEAPRRRVLADLSDRAFKEIEGLKIDLSDAHRLEARIHEEEQQLAYLFQDLREQEGVLELNRQLQSDLLRKNHEERLSQLENYRKLKGAEAQVEHLITQFNARKELEKANLAERQVHKALSQGLFAQMKGKLPFPVVGGRVVAGFGRAFDPKSHLQIFKKGLDIASGKKEPVHAISAGRVAFSGELPGYGKVTILDHGDHYYSLCAHLGHLNKQAGEAVSAGEVLGRSDDAGTPIYFEIRARNVAVNPLQWVSN